MEPYKIHFCPPKFSLDFLFVFAVLVIGIPFGFQPAEKYYHRCSIAVFCLSVTWISSLERSCAYLHVSSQHRVDRICKTTRRKPTLGSLKTASTPLCSG